MSLLLYLGAVFLLLWFWDRGSVTTTKTTTVPWQVIADAVFAAEMQADCDQTDASALAPNSSCQDDLQDVNVAPRIVSAKLRHGVWTVVVAVKLTGTGTEVLTEHAPG